MTDKKTALITGSDGGLGSCFVNIHAEKGGNLILVARNETKIYGQRKVIEKEYNVTVNAIIADLSESESAQRIYNTCKENAWKVDYLINNAGFGGQGDFTRERTMGEDLSMLAVNIEVRTRLYKLFLPDFVQRGSGCVLKMYHQQQPLYPVHCKHVIMQQNHIWQVYQMHYGES